MDEARAVLERLERIDALERENASVAQLLAELRELVREAETWARREGDEEAATAAGRCREALGRHPTPIRELTAPSHPRC